MSVNLQILPSLTARVAGGSILIKKKVGKFYNKNHGISSENFKNL